VLCPKTSKSAVKTIGRVVAKNKINLSVVKSVSDGILSMSEQMRGCKRIRRNAENVYVKAQEAGDGHISEDGRDRITLSERRAISLNMRLLKHKSQGRML
jgi:hypothetical protein